ncbi:MAG: YhcH/YjgK/YiaL family protein [Bacteroidales bacterium]|nr:YhcH/YjgK/YiaL family protein [Bacteroidales bacterium]
MDERLMNNPYYAKAIEYIRTHDLNALENGRHELDGYNLFVNIVDGKMRPVQEARLEVHDIYIDVQVPLSKGETYGVKPRSACTSPDGEMNLSDDIMFFDDPIEETVSAEAGDIVTFAPDMAHAPLIGEGVIHKAIFKVKVV